VTITDAEFVELMAHMPPTKGAGGIILAVHDRDWLVALCRDLRGKIGNLANYIMGHVPGEPSENQGAVDTAIRIMTTLQARVRELEEVLEDVREHGRLGDHSHWDPQGNAGRTCHVCMAQSVVRERVRTVLARRTP